ncbi:MAG: DUF1552 domain-containing protein [Phycisphaeraceae bacterium]|nr:DUF1552 domain-containing protein [Phycisphaeraceae bacterium]
MTGHLSRRRFLRQASVSAAALPFLSGLPSVSGAALDPKPRRLIIVFSPNGTVPDAFWPKQPGPIEKLPPILEPLDPFKHRLMTAKGPSIVVGGVGSRHIQGMGCLLTGNQLFPGNAKGGGNSPSAGWAKSISIDQEVANFFQSKQNSKTAFGSLQFGVAVPDLADPRTRMSYAGANQPLTPISDPRWMVDKLYGKTKDKASLLAIIDDVKDDLARFSDQLSPEDREMLERHMEHVAEMQRQLEIADANDSRNHPVPDIDPDIELINDNTPQISRVQIDLMVNAMANNMARVATLQYMRSVGQARMKWLNVKEGHHKISHEPDENEDARTKLIKINTWFAGEIAYLATKLRDTPEPGGVGGSMLDNTLILWVNELGKGNSHTLNNIPFVLIGGENLGIKQGQALELGKTPHNRLLMAIAKAMGHELESFGIAKYCKGGAIELG